MKKLFTLFILFNIFLLTSFVYPQSNKYSAKEVKKTNRISYSVNCQLSTTPKHSFDVLNYKLNLNIYNCFKSPFPKNFSADNTLTFRVDSTLNIINLNANNFSLLIDSIILSNGLPLIYSHSSNILAITLNRTYNPGEIVIIKIYYKHNNVYDTAFQANNGLVYTNCEPEGARCWFPCWDKPSDKATTDITAKVPSNVLLGSNGRLADSTKIADTIYYHWVSRDPMSTYLVVLNGSSNYRMSLQYWRKLSNPSDSVLVRMYYNSWSNPSQLRDSIYYVANYFSSKFIEYPFEKIGFAEVDSLGVGMENQTLIAVYPDNWNVRMAAHEFGHHWFGDLITCGTWADIWLNESFGTYCEALISEFTNGKTAYKNDISFDSSYYFSSQTFSEPIYNPSFINNTPPNGYLFFFPIRYCKGACVLYMLRNVLGDSLFFDVLKSYTNDTNFVLKNAVTDDFTAKINQVTGQDYTWFITEWVKNGGHPKYSITYGISNLGSGNWRVNFTIKQIQTTTTFYKMPVEIKIKFTNNTDTILKVVNNNVYQQLFTFNFNKQPDSVFFDPDNKIILKQVTTTIGIKNISNDIPERYYLYQNYPNPFNPATIIRFQIKDLRFVSLKVYDILGKEVATLVNEILKPGSYEIPFSGNQFPNYQIPSGIYFYCLQSGDFFNTKKMLLIK